MKVFFKKETSNSLERVVQWVKRKAFGMSYQDASGEVDFRQVQKPKRTRKNKRDPILNALLSGERLSQWDMASRFGYKTWDVRSLISGLRRSGYPIFNQRIEGSRKTLYFIAYPKLNKEQVNNKVFTSMPVPHGKFTMEIKK